VVGVEKLLLRGHQEVLDAGLADYSGSIPHTELLKPAARRIVDRGRTTRKTEARD
jgi:RNA-directed DNA polymerase